MPGKSIISSGDNRSSLSVQEKPLVFTQTTTTTTTKHFEFDNKAINFDDIKTLFENGVIAKGGKTNELTGTSFVKPLAALSRKRPLVDIQNRKSKQLSTAKRPSQWSVCDDNNPVASSAGPSTGAASNIDINNAALMESVQANIQQSYQKPNRKSQRLTESKTTTLNVVSDQGKRFNNLKMSRVNNISVLPWEMSDEDSSPKIVMANGRRIRGTPMKANGALSKFKIDNAKYGRPAPFEFKGKKLDLFDANISNVLEFSNNGVDEHQTPIVTEIMQTGSAKRSSPVKEVPKRSSPILQQSFSVPLLQSTQIELMPPPKTVPRLRGRKHTALATVSEISTIREVSSMSDTVLSASSSLGGAKLKSGRPGKSTQTKENMPSAGSNTSEVIAEGRSMRPRRVAVANYKEAPLPTNKRAKARNGAKKVAPELSVLTEATETFDQSPQQAVYDELFGEREVALDDNTTLLTSVETNNSDKEVSQTRSLRSRNGSNKENSKDKSKALKASTNSKKTPKISEEPKISKSKAKSKAKASKSKPETTPAANLSAEIELDASVTVLKIAKLANANDTPNESNESNSSQTRSLRSQSKQKSQTEEISSEPEKPSRAKPMKPKPKAKDDPTVATTKPSETKRKPAKAQTITDEASGSNDVFPEHFSDDQFTSPPPASVHKSRVNQLIKADSMAPIQIYSPSNMDKYKIASNNTIIITDKVIRKACGNRTHIEIDKQTRLKINADSKLFYLPAGATPKQMKNNKRGNVDPLALFQRKRQAIFAMSIEPDDVL